MPVTPRWQARILLYSIPTVLLAYQMFELSNAIKCQNSTYYARLRYGDSQKDAKADYAGEEGVLYRLTNILLFWKSDENSCNSTRMMPLSKDDAERKGSLSYLWPLFLSFCVSQFIETLSCSLQNRQPMPETGMTIFEHSLTFAEAETMISNRLGLGFFGIPRDLSTTGNSTVIGDEASIAPSFTRSMFLRERNVPSEVLLIAFISALSHFSSSILAIIGIRAKYRLITTGTWAVLYMVAFSWSIARVASIFHIVDTVILRFPTVCIVGFIPHILILVGICACAAIYAIAVFATALSPPSGSISHDTLKERLRFAYHNLQANVHLSTNSPLNVVWRDDFYTTLLKVGIAILTTASEAVYLNESAAIRASEQTWLEEKRVQEIDATLAKLRDIKNARLKNTVNSRELDNPTSSSNGISNRPDDRKQTCGYALEHKMTAKKQDHNTKQNVGRESGVGLRQRRGMWKGTFLFAKGILILSGSLLARLSLAILAKVHIRWGTNWLRRIANQSASRSKPVTRLSTQPTNNSISQQRNAISSYCPSPDMDVEVEARQALSGNKLKYPLDEEVLSSDLYDWWKAGGHWGEADTSGDYQPTDVEDDVTSIYSDGTAFSERDEEADDGSLTPRLAMPSHEEAEPSPEPESMLDAKRLALLLNPKTLEQREEAQLLARHLNSENVMTRSQCRRSFIQDKAALLASTRRHLDHGRLRDPKIISEEEEELMLERFILEKRGSAHGGESQRDQAREWSDGAGGMGLSGPLCVVCQQNPRTILIWPCGCLSLCDDCRLGLATRNYSNCACCRRSVTAYSRLYVP